MNWKRIFCKHQWVLTGRRHTFDTRGYILDTYYQMECKKCGRRFETECTRNYKYEVAEKQTSNLQEEELRRVLNHNGPLGQGWGPCGMDW